MKKLILFACLLLWGYRSNAQSTNDAGVNAITGPASPVLSGVSQPVAVTIKNYAASTLTAATIGFSVNGVVQPTFFWTGSLASNGTVAAVTIGNFTFLAGNHTVKAWTSNPNGAIDGNHANDTTTVTIATCTALNGTYTINKTAPASATNFQSFASVAQALTNCGIGGPVVFNVTGGPYNEAVTFTNVNGASASNTITFHGNANSLNNPALTGDALKLDGSKYFRFNNLKVENNQAATGGAVLALLNNAQNNIFTGCTFTHSISITAASWVINMQGGSSNNTFQNNTLIGGNYSINNSGTTSALNSNNQFTGNNIKDFYFTGIQTSNAPGALIEGNDISRPMRTTTSTFQGISIGSGCTGVTISKNRIHNTHDAISLPTGNYFYGIYLTGAGISGTENIVKNNAIYNINIPNGSVYGIYNSGGSNTYFYNNTISADNPDITYNTLRGIYQGSAFTNVKFINNNVSLTSPATSKHAVYLGSSGISLVSDRNNLYVGSSGNIGYYGTDKATLADWKAVNGSAYDQNSVSADPHYINLSTGNLRPTNAALNNTGQILTAVTDDITGAPRSTTAPDLGVYEFTPAANDAGIIAYVSAATPIVPNISTPVVVTLKNFGTAPLTAVAINWSVNNAAQTVYNWTGNLASYQTVNVTLGNYTFPGGNHSLNICASNPNGVADPNTDNDCQTVSIIACTNFAGTYTINKNAPASATNFVSFASVINSLKSCGVSAPVTFNVVAGSGPYNENISIDNISGASATNTITFNGNGNVVASPSALTDIVLKLDGAKYLRFNNLKIEEHPNTVTGGVIWMINGAQQNIFNGCHFTHSVINTNASYGVYMQAGSSFNKFTNNTITGAYYGIYNNGMPNLPNSNNQFIGNILKDQFAYGIYSAFSPVTLIEGNDISRPNRTNGTVFFGINFSTGVQTTISKNRIHNTHDVVTVTGDVYGIYYAADGTAGNENIIKNNVLYNFNNTGGTLYVLYSAGSNTYYYHNTISVDNPNVNFANVRGIDYAAPVTNVKFIDNIISISSPATLKHAIYLGSTAPPIISNYNNLYVPNGNVGYLSGDIGTLALWALANQNAYDQNSYSLNPIFANAVSGNLRPTAPGADNLGQPIPTVTDDINGNSRSTTTPDIGAYEFTINQNDVGITNITGPVATGCGLTAAETITVTIKNYGTSAQTSIPVSYTLNAGTPVNETFTGALPAGGTAIYTFAAKANMVTGGVHTFAAQTNLPNDAVAVNNDTTLTITNALVPTLPAKFDFETPVTGMNKLYKVTNAKSNIWEDAAASFGTGSTKGMIMDGVGHAGWVPPVGVVDTWTSNSDNFSGIYICISPAGGPVADSLYLTFDLKQLFKGAYVNTNFRVTVNGTQTGQTYQPPFSGLPINWQKVKVDLTKYINDPFVKIGLESIVKEAYDNGNGTANLIDNIEIRRVGYTGVKDATLAAQLNVFPNPGNGIFNVELPESKTYELIVSDLAGKVMIKQVVKGGRSQLKLEGTAKGIYLVKVTSEKGTAVRKLIIE
ncbi:T9SS type A sorting domain-containing protein [Adhaeribacter sp. BT258]|uniref:T9SS type A sorting domain-containing protein n=1 Tax=Adhaeribacter terrigena TaxID=2793070 RepID=A0ABS1BXP5_9BACT|nr:T9SS type A sorting domain-containing protein [Adhaeribacter terrigena]MBK0401882.1 T9SS type A sorting domain-containing protein [Adhaeribacter terrigena]